jgi:hypothetical protein
MTPYDLLLVLARREACLVDEGRWAEVVALWDQRETLQASLPETPPADAGPALAEALELVRSTESVLHSALADVATELRGLAESRRAALAYSQGSISPTT